jgi:hypothetical protein
VRPVQVIWSLADLTQAMEHAVYICSWSRSSDGFTLWVKSRPQIRASAPTYAEAEERLIEAIQDTGGAMQAVMEFDPPLPKSILEEKYSTPEIYLIGGDDRFETDAPRWKSPESRQEVEERLRWLDAFYDQPVCRKCKYTSGRRNDKPVTLTYAGKYDGAFGSFGTDGGPSHQLVSEEFLALLEPDEKRSLQFQPTVRKGRKKFYELVGPEGPPYVAVAGITISGWRCTQCDHRTWGYWVEGMAINSFVARSDLSAQSNGVFTVGTFPEIQLAVAAPRWKALLDKKGTRGFASRQIGVVPDHEVVRCPELPTYEQQLAKRRLTSR